MAIDNDALLAAIDEARENAYGSDEQSELGRKRARAIEYYLGLNTNPAPEGRSQVVDRSVYETIATMLPSLVRIFASSSDQICKMTPVGPEDEQGAEQATAVLNHVVTEQNQWEQVCGDWIHDALLLNNGYAMAWWDESQNLVREVYEGQSEDQVAALMQDTNVRVLQHSQSVDKQATADAMREYQQAAQQHQMMQAQAEQAAAQGQQVPPLPPPPEQPQPVVLHDLVIERVENEGKVCIKVLPPEHCYVSADTPDWTLRDCPYFEFRQQKTIAELRSMGLKVDEWVSDDDDYDDTDEDLSRDRFGEDRELGDGMGVMRRVWARMIWIRADAEGDGQTRLYYVIAVGRTILFTQPVARIPVSSMVAQPLPHRHVGMSVAETVQDIQDIRTAVTRGGLDNLYLANNGRHVISTKVNVEDFLDARPGGVVRMNDDSLPSEGHILPLTHPVAFEQIIGSLEYFDQMRQNRTGATRYFSGTDAGAINKTASGTMALQNAAAMRVEHIARTMAPAVESLFSAVQEIISKHQNKALTLKLKGNWVTVDPQAWRTKRDIRISVGVGAGNKESMQAQLGAIFAAQMQLLPLGVAGPEQLHATVSEMAKLAGFANPQKFWLDPSQSQPPPPQPSPDQIKAQTTMQVEQMRIQADAQKFQATMQAKIAEIQMQAQAKQAEMQAQLEVQAANDQRDALKEQQRAEMQAQIESLKLATDREIAAMNAELAKYKADLDAQVKLTIAGQQNETAKAPALELGGIKEMVEKLAGSQTVAATKIRGADGRLAGVRITQADGSTREVPVQ